MGGKPKEDTLKQEMGKKSESNMTLIIVYVTVMYIIKTHSQTE